MDVKSFSTNTNNLLDIKNNLKPIRHKSDKIHKTTKNIEDFTNFFTKKIKFSSAFDHIGSKQFLNSKKEALELIVLDEDSILSNNENEMQNNKKKERKMKYENSKTFITKNKRPRSSKIITDIMSKNNLRNKIQEKKRLKGKDYSDKKEKNKRINTLIVQKFNNKNKELSKFFSSQELKMFEDKEVKKIKPIKKLYNDSEINKKKNNTKISQFQFVGSGISIDSSLFDFVSQMH